MTIVVEPWTTLPLEQVTKQLNKLINVLKIVELHVRPPRCYRELLLIKLRADSRRCGPRW